VFTAQVAFAWRQHTPPEQIELVVPSQSRLFVHAAPSGVTAQPEGVQLPEQQSVAVVHGARAPRQQVPCVLQRPYCASQQSPAVVHASFASAQHVPRLQ